MDEKEFPAILRVKAFLDPTFRQKIARVLGRCDPAAIDKCIKDVIEMLAHREAGKENDPPTIVQTSEAMVKTEPFRTAWTQSVIEYRAEGVRRRDRQIEERRNREVDMLRAELEGMRAGAGGAGNTSTAASEEQKQEEQRRVKEEARRAAIEDTSMAKGLLDRSNWTLVKRIDNLRRMGAEEDGDGRFRTVLKQIEAAGCVPAGTLWAEEAVFTASVAKKDEWESVLCLFADTLESERG